MLARSRLDVVVGRALGTVLMTVRGPLRKNTSQRFITSLRRALREAPERVVVDLTGVTVLDDDGIVVLQEAKHTAEAEQVQLVLTSKRRELLAAVDGLADDFTVV
ncbi:MAG TPA: STAS domain-containing protein [Acidimicrobiales bacterium]|jgi:anti-anti-sigma regulatory factor|nr:STAS domain-containing protein [Acidimicrobiales bacterium]